MDIESSCHCRGQQKGKKNKETGAPSSSLKLLFLSNGNTNAPPFRYIYHRTVETVISINLNNALPCPHLLVVINYSMLFCSHSACPIIVLTTVIEKLTPPRNIPFIQVSCISNEKNMANTREDDGKVIVSFFFPPYLLHRDCGWGLGGWYFFNLCLSAELCKRAKEEE